MILTPFFTLIGAQRVKNNQREFLLPENTAIPVLLSKTLFGIHHLKLLLFSQFPATSPHSRICNLNSSLKRPLLTWWSTYLIKIIIIIKIIKVIKFLLIIITLNLMKKVQVHGQRGKSSEEPTISKLSLVHVESDNEQVCKDNQNIFEFQYQSRSSL